MKLEDDNLMFLYLLALAFDMTHHLCCIVICVLLDSCTSIGIYVPTLGSMTVGL
jgi:hypothetical protein